MGNNKGFWNYIALAALAGGIGLQEFYVRKYVAGIFAVLFCWTCIPAIVAYIEILVWIFKGKDKFNITFNIPKDSNKIILKD